MITLVTGGQRSGKSAFAESLALRMSSNPVYLATANVYDDEIRQRVEKHRQRRGDVWVTLEEPLFVGDTEIPYKSTVLLDCLTMLATNWFFHAGEDVEKAWEGLQTNLTSLLARQADLILVTNEIGLGGVSADPMQRKFTDLQGRVNQMVAEMADRVYFVVSGIPLKIK